MTVSVTAGPRQPQSDGKYRLETATATGAVSLDTNATVLLGGTATGFGNKVFTLADGQDGQDKEIYLTATGEVYLALTSTATGRYVYGQDDYSYFRFVNDQWRAIVNSATVATAT